MVNLEDQDSWPTIVKLKDSLTLMEIARRFGTTPGAVSAAFKRTGTSRAIAAAGVDDLPPEPGDDPDDLDELDEPDLPEEGDDLRPGSKDALIAQYLDELGQVPDAEVAEQAGVSVRTVASFRARHQIPGYRGPRRPADARSPRRSRIDPFVQLLGKVADRVVAEKAGVSLNAVRNYRVKRGIRASGRAAEVAPPATVAPAAVSAAVEASATVARVAPKGRRIAWRVTWRTPAGEEVVAVLVASDLIAAAALAAQAKVHGDVVALTLAGPLLD